MNLRSLVVIGALGSLLVWVATDSSLAQTSDGEVVGVVSPAELPAKAQRYYDALRRSPQPGLIFERFCDAWLADRSAEDLEGFLRRQSEAGDPADQLILGFYFAREGRNVEAIRVFRETLEHHPGQASAWFFKAEIEAATLDFETALSDLESAAAAGPHDALAADIAELQGRLLVRIGRRDEGLAAWAKLLERRPDDPEVYENLIVIQVEEGLFDPAIETLDRLIERTADPQKKVGRQLWRGDVLQQAGRKNAAITVYEAALDQVGSGGWLERQILSQIEQVYRRDQELDRFAERLAELSSERPGRVELARRRARVLTELGETAESIEQWKALLERVPGDRELRSEFADVLADADRTPEAIDLIEVLLADRPDDGEMRLRLAGLYKKADRDEDAVEQVRAFVDGSDGSLSSVVRAARTLERLELKEPAEALLRQHAERNPVDPGAGKALAELLYRIGQQDEAVAMWRAMAETADGSADLLDAARALSSRGQAQPAQEALLGRVEAFADDPEVLGALAEVSLRSGEPAAATPWLRPWVRAIEDTESLERAVDTAARVARASELDDDLIRELTEATAESRADGETWLLANLHEQRGDTPAADATLEQAGDDSEALIRARVGLLKGRGDYAQAAETLRVLVDRPGGTRSVLLRELIDLYAKDLRIDEALMWVERWKQASPGSISPWLRQASLLEGEGKDKQSTEVLERASRQFPDDVSVASTLAEAYAQQGRESDARRVYWRLYDASESTAGKLSWARKLAELTRYSDRGEDLIHQFEQRRDQDRNNIEPYLALAEVYRVLNRYEERRASLMEAARVQPENLELLLTIARTEQQAGDLEQAAATLRRAMPLDQNGRVRQQLASLHVYLGQPDRAMALLNDPESGSLTPEEAMRFADALMAQDDWESAAAFLTPRVEAEPDDYRLAYLYGVALNESLQTETATSVFLSVLDINQERPSTGAAPQDPFAAYTQMLQRMMPADAMALIRQQWASHRAASYRRRGMHTMYSGGSGVPQVVTLPVSYTDAHSLAIAHLRLIAEDSDEAYRDELTAAMQGRGVRLAHVLMDMTSNPHGGVELTPDIVEKHRDEPAVLALGIMMAGWGRDQLDPELLEHGIEQFAEEWPELALMASLGLLGQADDAQAAEMWPGIEQQLDRIDEPTELMIPALASYTGAMPQQGQSVTLSDEQRRVLTAKLRQWYLAMDANSQYRPWLMQSIISSMLESEDWAALGQFIAAETRRHRERNAGRATGRQAAQMRMMMRQRQGVIQELNFPPDSLASIPGELTGVLGGQRNMYGMTFTVDHEALLGELPQDAPPLLRALIAGAAEDGDTLTAELDAILTGPQPTLDAFLARAAWEGREGSPAEAAKRLIRASYLPMSRADRRVVDGATVAYALASDDDLSDEIKSSAQRAALRLRQSAVTYEDRSAVVEALEDLGLEEEAERMEERLASAPSSQTSMVRGFVQTRSLSGTDRIRDLLAEGRREDAVKLAHREVQTLAQNMMGGNVWMLQNSDARNLLNMVRSRDMVDEVIAEADPGSQARGQRRVMFGVVLEVLDQTDRAAEVYRASLADRPDAGAASQLFMIELKRDDPAAAAAVLSALPSRMMASIGNQLVQQFHYRANNDPLFVLSLAEAAALWIEASDDPESLPANWTTNLWHWLTNNQHYSGRSLPHLYNAKARANDDAKSKPIFDVDLQQKRLVAHDRLAGALLRIPSVAPDAAARLALSAELRGQPLEEYIGHIETALQHKPSRGGVHTISYSYSRQYQPDVLPLRSAAEALALYAARHGQPDRVEAVAQTLRSQRRKSEAERLEAIHALHAAPPETFLAAVETWIRLNRRPPGSASPAMRPVIDAWIDDGRPEIALEPVLLEVVKRDQHGSNDLIISMMRYASELAERDGSSAASECLERFATVYIGPADKRVELINKHFSNQGWRPNSLNGKMQLYTQSLAQAFENPRLVWAALDQLAPFAASTQATHNVNYNHRVYEVFDNMLDRAASAEDPAEALIAELEGSKLLADIPEFRSYVFEGRREGRSGIDLLRRYAAEANKEKWGPVVDRAVTSIESRPKTIGTVLTVSALRNEDLGVTLAKLTPYHGAIEGMDPTAQTEILAALPPIEEAGLADADPKVRALAELLGGARADTLTDRAQKILDIRAFDPHSNQAWEMSRGLPTLLMGLYREGRGDTAFELFAHWDGLVLKQRRNQGHSNGRSSERFLREILDSYRDGEEDDSRHLACLAFFVDAAGRSEPRIWLESWVLHASQNRLDKLLASVEPIAGEQDVQPRRYAAGLEQLAQPVESLHAAPLLYALYAEADDRHQPRNYAQGFDLLGELRAKEEATDRDTMQPGSLWVTAEAALRLARWKEADDDHPALAEDLAFVDRYLIALAADPSLPVTTRLGVLRQIASVLNRDTPPDTAAAAGRLMIETLNKEATLVRAPVVEELLETLWTVGPAEGRPTDPQIVKAYLDVVSRKARPHENDLLRVSLPHPYNVVSGRTGLGGPRASLIVLEMALRQDLQDAVEKLLRLENHRLATCPAAWALLAQHGRTDLAAEAIRRSYADARPARVWGILYTPAIAEATPRLLAALDREDDDGLRFLAEAALASLADISDDEQDPRYLELESTYAGLPSRSERLAELAERFASVSIRNPALREAVLLTLASDDQAASLLEAPLAEACSSVTLASLSAGHDHTVESKRQLVYASLVGPMRRGDPAPVIAQIEAINDGAGLGSNSGWQLRNQHRQLKRLFTRCLEYDPKRDNVTSGPEDLVALRDAWAMMLRPAEFIQHPDVNRRDLAMLVVLYALDPAADMAGFDTWWDQMPSHLNVGQPHGGDVRYVLGKLVKRPSISPERRVDTIVRAITSGISIDSSNVLERMVFDDKLLNADELAEHGERFTANWGARGKIGLASALARGKQAAAESAWNDAIQAVTDTQGDKSYEADRLLLIERLVKHKQLDLADAQQKDWKPADAKIGDRLEKLRKKHFPPAEKGDKQDSSAMFTPSVSLPQESS